MDRKAREDQKTQGVQTARYVDDDDLLDTGLETARYVNDDNQTRPVSELLGYT